MSGQLLLWRFLEFGVRAIKRRDFTTLLGRAGAAISRFGQSMERRSKLQWTLLFRRILPAAAIRISTNWNVLLVH
jgi:hypothetical protein